MSSFFSTRIAAAAIVGLTVFAATSPAAAASKPKPVTLPASVFKTDATKLCMPTPNVRDAKTQCLTRAEWEAQGVTFNLK